MLRRRIQRLSCAANTLGFVLLFCVIVVHVVHRRSAANVGPGDDAEVVFWFEEGDDGDDQPAFHRPFSINPRVLLGAAGTFCIAALCDAGGLTGASTILSLFVPLYCFVVGFGLKEATGLAQAAIAGASCTSLAFNLFRSHPWDPSKPVIDVDLALILTPTSLLGVSVGVLLNDLLPNWLITALLVGLLAYVCRRKAIVGLTTLHEEAQQEAAAQAAAAISSGPVPQLRPICTVSSSIDSTPRQSQQQQQQRIEEPVLSSRSESHDSVSSSAAWIPASAAAAATAAISPSSSTDCGNISSAHTELGIKTFQQQQQQHAVMQDDDQQQVQQHWGNTLLGCFSSSNSTSCDDLKAPLLEIVDNSPQGPTTPTPAAAAAAATAAVDTSSRGGGSSSAGGGSSRSKTYLQNHPVVPFLASVSLPLPSPKIAAAAARHHDRRGRSAVFAGHVISVSAFPWTKFVSMVLLCLGFCGLAMLGGLIPLCSWYYVDYLASFLGLTVFVTVVMVKVILVDPLQYVAHTGRLFNSIEEGQVSDLAAAAAASDARGGSNSSSSSSTGCRMRRVLSWFNAIAGTEVEIKPWMWATVEDSSTGNAAAAAIDPEQQQQQQQSTDRGSSSVKMSLFRREQIKQQQRQQPFWQRGAQAAAHDANDFVGECDEISGCGSTVNAPQSPSLVHTAAAGAAVAAAAGIVSGVCGVAGAALLTPILLDFRVHPQVATATSVLLVCMSSGIAVLSFLMQGRLIFSYAVLFAAVSVIGVCAGVWVIGALVRLTCKASHVTLFLAVMTGVTAFVTLLFGSEEFAVNFMEGEGLGFRALCVYS